MYKYLEAKMCKELEILEEKYRTGMDMNEGDLRRIDLLVHALKSMATYKAMKEAEEMQNGGQYMSQNMNNSYMNNSYMNGNSYARGRVMDGRYMSRDMDPNMSGYMQHPYYPEERRF